MALFGRASSLLFAVYNVLGRGDTAGPHRIPPPEVTTVDRTEQLKELASAHLVQVMKKFAETQERVTLYLGNGDHKDGKLASVTDALIHLRELTGKEFYDAFIATDEVVGVEIRARG